MRQDLSLSRKAAAEVQGSSWCRGNHFPPVLASFGLLGIEVREPLGCLGLLSPAAPWFLAVPPRSLQEAPLAKHSLLVGAMGLLSAAASVAL